MEYQHHQPSTAEGSWGRWSWNSPMRGAAGERWGGACGAKTGTGCTGPGLWGHGHVDLQAPNFGKTLWLTNRQMVMETWECEFANLVMVSHNRQMHLNDDLTLANLWFHQHNHLDLRNNIRNKHGDSTLENGDITDKSWDVVVNLGKWWFNLGKLLI